MRNIVDSRARMFFFECHAIHCFNRSAKLALAKMHKATKVVNFRIPVVVLVKEIIDYCCNQVQQNQNLDNN